jgi:electron transport complex protein RnfC
VKLLSYFRGEAFQRGVHPASCKLTATSAIRRLPFPPRVTVPLSQHIGKVPRPIVRVGQEVVRGQPIAKSEEWLSVPHHAPLTGVVEFIGLRPGQRGTWIESIVIRAHPGASQEDLWGQPRDLSQATGQRHPAGDLGQRHGGPWRCRLPDPCQAFGAEAGEGAYAGGEWLRV